MPPKRPLAVERAARKDLRAFPALYRDSAVARAYLLMARTLDDGVPAREAAGVAREMRLIMLALNALAPPKPEDDFVDEARAEHEQGMARVHVLREAT